MKRTRVGTTPTTLYYFLLGHDYHCWSFRYGRPHISVSETCGRRHQKLAFFSIRCHHIWIKHIFIAFQSVLHTLRSKYPLFEYNIQWDTSHRRTLTHAMHYWWYRRGAHGIKLSDLRHASSCDFSYKTNHKLLTKTISWNNFFVVGKRLSWLFSLHSKKK